MHAKLDTKSQHIIDWEKQSRLKAMIGHSVYAELLQQILEDLQREVDMVKLSIKSSHAENFEESSSTIISLASTLGAQSLVDATVAFRREVSGLERKVGFLGMRRWQQKINAVEMALLQHLETNQ